LPINVFKAGELIDHAYNKKLGAIIKEQVDVGGAQAFYLNDGTLVIPGTNERSDWLDFNLDFEAIQGDSGRFYHKGFLEHARLIYMFAKAVKPKFIVGHSLGAASAQIVGRSLRVPTIAFASPKVLRGKTRVSGEGWVANYLRIDDTVCHMPPGLGKKKYRHIGSTYWMGPKGIDVGEDHRIKNYMQVLKEERFKLLIPKDWPQ
jgi:hypothetical protein